MNSLKMKRRSSHNRKSVLFEFEKYINKVHLWIVLLWCGDIRVSCCCLVCCASISIVHSNSSSSCHCHSKVIKYVNCQKFLLNPFWFTFTKGQSRKEEGIYSLKVVYFAIKYYMSFDNFMKPKNPNPKTLKV